MKTVKILGFIDILAGLILLSFIFGVELPFAFLIFISVILLAKSSLAIFSLVGFLDLIVSFLIMIGYFANLPDLLIIPFLLFVTFKGFSSMG